VVRPGQLAVADKNTAALPKALPPTTQTELRSFLGLCKVYRRFVPGFAKIAGPFNNLLRKGESPQLGPLNAEQLVAFNSLREKLFHSPSWRSRGRKAISPSTRMLPRTRSAASFSRTNLKEIDVLSATGVEV
jgi:hypothetical protein